MATSPSGKADACKAFMRRSESYCGLLWVRSSMAEFVSPKRTMGVQVAPGLPVPLYWPCLLNMRCITGRCWFKSSQGCSCSHSSIGSERHSAKVEVNRSNRFGSTERFFMEAVAQLAERLVVTEKVTGSWPVSLPWLYARAGEMGYHYNG